MAAYRPPMLGASAMASALSTNIEDAKRTVEAQLKRRSSRSYRNIMGISMTAVKPLIRPMSEVSPWTLRTTLIR